MKVAIASCAAALRQGKAALADCAAQAVSGTASSGELQDAAQDAGGCEGSRLRWRLS